MAHFKEIQIAQKTEVGFVNMDPNDPEQCVTAVDALYNFLMEQIAKAKEMRAQEQEAAKVKKAPRVRSTIIEDV